MISGFRYLPIAALIFLVACSSVPPAKLDASAASASFVKRDFQPTIDGKWIGNGISYGAYRDGEGPGKGLTSKANILEDMQIMTQRWNLIRLYGSDPQSERILEVIRDNDIPMRVMLGAWLDGHKSVDENNEQVRRLIELANRFPEIVVAANVGNEIFVYWSWHKIDDVDWVIDHIRNVRASIEQPVTVSDDYNFWNKPESQKVAAELDFICMHGYALWNSQQLSNGLGWTVETYNDIQSHHPDHKIAFCETGWATSKVDGDGSDEDVLVVGVVGQDEQKVFFDQYDQWINDNQVISFYFSSFDEQWKGGFDGADAMDKMEKHWGLYKSDRSPKKAMQ